MRQALDALEGLPGTRLTAASRLYRSAPLGPPGQPPYVNAAAGLETRLAPLDLLRALQALEDAQGRRRDGPRWGPRTLDLDLLLYQDWVMESEALRLPHPEMHRRAFVLLPLLEIAGGGLRIPGHGRLSDLCAACDPGAALPLETCP